jgi:hypothetical protein
MGGVHSTHGGDDGCIQNFRWKNPTGRNHIYNPVTDIRMALKIRFENFIPQGIKIVVFCTVTLHSLVEATNILEDHTASIFRPEDRDSKLL